LFVYENILIYTMASEKKKQKLSADNGATATGASIKVSWNVSNAHYPL
jgi:hypothetical protein